MKSIVFLVFCALFSMMSSSAMASDCSKDGWLCRDKALHLGGSAAVAAAITVATKDERIGFWTTVAIGAAKEAYDAKHRDRHTPSWRDFGADVAGAYVGSKIGAVIVVRRNQILISKSF